MSYRSAYDLELSKLDDDILKLGSLCEEALGRAMDSLSTRNLMEAHQVVMADEQINQLRYDLEDRCYRLLATQQPAARDLRHIVAVIHIASELERIGDHASGIARLVERLEGHTDIDTLRQLPKMGRRCQKMIRVSLQAFVSRDAELAASAIERDEKIDRQYGKFSAAVLADMNRTQDELDFVIPTYLLWMAHNLERIGDRVTNIAERVIFMVTGRFVEDGH